MKDYPVFFCFLFDTFLLFLLKTKKSNLNPYKCGESIDKIKATTLNISMHKLFISHLNKPNGNGQQKIRHSNQYEYVTHFYVGK